MKPPTFNREIFGAAGAKTTRQTGAQHKLAKRRAMIRRRAIARERRLLLGEAPPPDEESAGVPGDGLDELEVLPDV